MAEDGEDFSSKITKEEFEKLKLSFSRCLKCGVTLLTSVSLYDTGFEIVSCNKYCSIILRTFFPISLNLT